MTDEYDWRTDGASQHAYVHFALRRGRHRRAPPLAAHPAARRRRPVGGPVPLPRLAARVAGSGRGGGGPRHRRVPPGPLRERSAALGRDRSEPARPAVRRVAGGPVARRRGGAGGRRRGRPRRRYQRRPPLPHLPSRVRGRPSGGGGTVAARTGRGSPAPQQPHRRAGRRRLRLRGRVPLLPALPSRVRRAPTDVPVGHAR